jgi:hypothetical protein
MEALTDLPASTSKRLCGAQCCRLFLQATTLADISNSAGTHLSEWVTNPRYAQPSQRQQTHTYPNQAKPSSTIWNDFLSLLQLAFTEGTNNKLHQPLGNWYQGRISSLTMTYFKESSEKLNHFQLHRMSNGSKGTKIDTNREMNYHSKQKANCIADDVCTETHHQHPSKVGHLPDWIPGTKAALLHHRKLITKKQDDYVTTAATAPRLRKCLIKKSKRHDPFLKQDWDATTFEDIDWKGMRSSFGGLTKGRQFQLSKYAHNWTLTLHQ